MMDHPFRCPLECRDDDCRDKARCHAKAKTGKQQVFDMFGQYLLEHKHPVLKQYLEYLAEAERMLIGILQSQQGERALARLPEVEKELEQIRIALGYF